MSGNAPEEIRPEGLEEALARAVAAPVALLALGMPLCGACQVLPFSLAEVARARPEIVVAMAELRGPEDWAARERLLWPRGIRVSRATVPAMALLRDGRAISTRHGGGPAAAIDAWLARHLGPATHPMGADLGEGERAALEGGATHRARQAYVKGAGLPI